MIYDLHHRQAALLVIDVQGEYFDEDGPAYVEHARDIVGNVNRLVDLFRAEGLPIVFVKHMQRADGSDAGRMGDFSAPGEEDSFVEGTPRVELIPELHVKARDIVVVKRRYVVICGLMTSFCCETTARDAHGRDYEVLFAADAVEGPDLEDTDGREVPHDAVLANTVTALGAGFAEIVTTDDVIARLG
jgi:nicotinamidase-related amidase